MMCASFCSRKASIVAIVRASEKLGERVTHMYVCMYVCIYVRTYVFIYICVYACMRVCVFIVSYSLSELLECVLPLSTFEQNRVDRLDSSSLENMSELSIGIESERELSVVKHLSHFHVVCLRPLLSL